MRILLVLVLAFLFVVPAQATTLTLNVDNNGILMNASNVMVAGTPYDVAFLDGTCASVLGACDVDHFITNDVAMATQFSQALLSQVFVDGPAGSFNTMPSATFGCGPNTMQDRASICIVLTPYGIVLGGAEIRMSEVVNWWYCGIDCDEINLTGSLISYDTTPYRSVWAKWSVSSQSVSVPEPSSLLLLVISLMLLVVQFRRRRFMLSAALRKTKRKNFGDMAKC